MMSPRALLLLSILAVASPAPASTWIVDDDGLGGPDDCGTDVPALGTIQAGINVALPGDFIYVCPGTYREQIEILVRDVTIRGAGADRTVVRPERVEPRTSRLSGDSPVAAIVVADGVRNVILTDLTIDGRDADFGTCTAGYVGIYFRGASGAVRRSGIRNVFHEHARHCENVHAILVEGDGEPTPGERVVIDENRLDHFGKSGITAEAPRLELHLTGNTIRGWRPVGPDAAAQTGIRIAAKDGSLVQGNRISGLRAVSRRGTACGIVVGKEAGHPTGRNTFSNNERNVCRASGASS